MPASAPAPAAAHPALLRLTDTAVVVSVMAAAFIITAHGRLGGLEEFLLLRVSVKNVLLLAAFVVLCERIFVAMQGPAMWANGGRHRELVQVMAGCTTAAFVASMVPLVDVSGTFGMRAIAIFWITSIPATLVARRVTRTCVGVVGRIVRPRQVLIVGSGPLARAAYHSVRDCCEARYEVLGFVDTNERIAFQEIRDRHLGELADLEWILMRRNVDLVVIALPVKSCYSSIQDVIRTCERIGVESRYNVDIFNGELARHEYAPVAAMPSVAMKVVQDDARMMIKRCIDIAASVLGIIVLLPLLLVIAAAIRLTSPGPVLFAQDRYGLNRRVFRMYKFRTMVADAEAMQPTLEHLNEASGPVFKIGNDPRITPVGRVLRRTSLDELPQLINVLKGDMSLVGPRPLPLRDVRHFRQCELMRRFSVRPGITGLWQVSGRSSLPFNDWIALDLRYIDVWSLGLDLRILLRTLPAVVRGTGAC
jgi:exopolysaccharide biosynthesis polyprenyl glycosylphosphotransferase